MPSKVEDDFMWLTTAVLLISQAGMRGGLAWLAIPVCLCNGIPGL